MPVLSQLKKNNHRLRNFTVGVVGASTKELGTITRILTVTHHRARSYELVNVDINQINRRTNMDIILMCSGNPAVIELWESSNTVNDGYVKPMVYISRPDASIRSGYQLQTPINPSQLVKTLDRYTIKELNFFPEFEIGKESAELDVSAANGLEILRETTHTNNNRKTCSRALVADDSLAVRKQMQIEFNLLQDALDTVEDGQTAITEAEKRKYDVIFLDVVMPGIDGYTACKKIKRTKLNKDTPVIMLTSKSSSFDKIKGALAGCDAYLVKPINHNEFETVYTQHVHCNRS